MLRDVSLIGFCVGYCGRREQGGWACSKVTGGKKSCLCRCDCLCNFGVGVRVFHVFHAMDFQPVTSEVHRRLF